MPRCKNAKTGRYKGTEPSPKGLGYCARGEKIGKKKKGLDGNMWEVKETKKGVTRWVKITKIQKSTKKKSTKKKSKSIKKWDTKKIIVHKNKKIYKSGNKISISNNNLIYLSFGEKKTTGRIYFGLNNLKNTKKDIIKDLKLNKKKQTFEFRYHGDWEDESNDKFKIIKVNDKWKVVFEDKKEFDKMEGFVSQFDIVKIIN